MIWWASRLPSGLPCWWDEARRRRPPGRRSPGRGVRLVRVCADEVDALVAAQVADVEQRGSRCSESRLTSSRATGSPESAPEDAQLIPGAAQAETNSPRSVGLTGAPAASTAKRSATRARKRAGVMPFRSATVVVVQDAHL